MKIAPPNLLDRAIAAIAPGFGVKRIMHRSAFLALTGGYTGGKTTGRRATTSWRPGGGSADADLIPDLPTLRARTRDAERNHPIAAAASNRAADLTVGDGLMVLPQIDRDALKIGDEEAAAWEAEAARIFELWGSSPNCDATRTQNFYELQQVVFSSAFISGDAFGVPRLVSRPAWPFQLAWQLFEGDQISNPDGATDGSTVPGGVNRLVGGVELDNMGAPVAYHFQQHHPGEIAPVKDQRSWSRVPAFGDKTGERFVHHFFRRRRIGSTRGVPELAPVIEQLKQISTYTDAELMAAVIGSMFVVVRKTKSGGKLAPVQPTDETGQAAGDGDYKIASGVIADIQHDDDVSVPNIGRPNPEFAPFLEGVVTVLGAAIGIPYEVLLQHFTASYSASRAALEMAWRFVMSRRAWLERIFCQPSYEMVIAEAVADGRLAAPGFFEDPKIRAAWLGALWIGPGKISVDPLKENNADAISADRGWETDSEITARKTGTIWAAKQRQRLAEKKMREEAGLVGGKPPAPQIAPPAARPGDAEEDAGGGEDERPAGDDTEDETDSRKQEK